MAYLTRNNSKIAATTTPTAKTPLISHSCGSLMPRGP